MFRFQSTQDAEAESPAAVKYAKGEPNFRTRKKILVEQEGLIGPKNLGDFWVFPPIFNIILMPKWGFNYSKMAKYRFLIDSNTFLTILGTSKILSKSGPVTLPIAVNLLLKIQEKYGIILRKYGFLRSENLKISKFPEVLCTEPQDFLFFLFFL